VCVSATLTPIDVKVHVMADYVPDTKSSLGGDIFRGHQMRDQKIKGVGFCPLKSYFTVNISKTVKLRVAAILIFDN